MKPTLILAVACCLMLSGCDYIYRSYYEASYPQLIGYALLVILLLVIINRWTKHQPEKEHDLVHTHQYYHFEDLQLSSKEFYDVLSELIKERSFPNVTIEIETLQQSGFLSSKRDYLRVRQFELEFYICAAPFGKNFFISYWLKDMPPGCIDIFQWRVFGYRDRKTFYQIDREVIFRESIKTAVHTAIKSFVQDKGLRSLTEEELIPKSV